MIFPIDLPPGALRNGTAYESKGRWRDVNLVRWLDGSLRPIGGWQQWGSGTFTGIPRGIYAWTDSTGNRWIAFGTASKLYVANQSATISDVTPGVAATGTLTLTANAANGETVTIDAKTYTFQTTLTNADGNVLVGATASDSLDNLIAAITLGAGSGTVYAAATTEHPTVTASAGAGDTMTATAKTDGTAGNSIGTSETLVSGSWGGATLSGGSDGLTVGNVDATSNIGYGNGVYGSDAYGIAREDVGSITPASTWAMDGWGQYLVGCMEGDGKIWEWQLSPTTDAAQVSGSPTGCIGLVVTQERFLMALGAGGDPRKVQWCDQGDNTVWTSTATNQAGDFILETDGEIRCGIKMPGETLILTSTDLWTARYQGLPLVYGFQRAGSGCGAAGNRVAIKLDRAAVWLGHGGFFLYDGYVRKLECDVWDLLVERASPVQISKAFGWLNVDHQEAVWLIPSDIGGECDFYVTWNYAENWWSFCDAGAFDRSCGTAAAGVFADPILCGTDGKLYRHESGTDHGAETPYAESGPIELGTGERWMHARMVYPDEKTLGQTTLTFKTRAYPTATEIVHGPYSMANPTSVRFGGRQVVMRASANSASDWRLGVPRLDLVAGGKR